MLTKLSHAIRNQKGFTLMELIGVIAIIIILMGLGAVGVTKYIRTMHQLEMDGYAKEVFVAAQNHLSQAESQGYLGRTDFGIPETDGTNETGNYFFVLNDAADFGSDGILNKEDSVLGLMLPLGSLDDTVRSSGSYLLRYNKSSGTMLDVFYASSSGSYKCALPDEESQLSNIVEYYRGVDKKHDRLMFGETASEKSISIDNANAVLGYFGGEGNELTVGETLNAPIISIVNSDKLLVRVQDKNPGWKDEEGNKSTLKLIVTGNASHNSREFLIYSDTQSSPAYPTASQSEPDTYVIVLDDITSPGSHFQQLCCDGKDPLIPGENITVTAVAYSANAQTNTAASAAAVTNSLFADVKGSEGDGYVAKIAYTRHLENLDKGISNFDNSRFPLSKAEQTKDISFAPKDSPYGESGFLFNVGKESESIIYSCGGTALGKAGSYVPVSYPSALHYDGGDHKLSAFVIDTDSEAGTGIFAELKAGSSVKNLELVNFDVNAQKGNAGALAGNLTDTEITGILVHNAANLQSNTEASLAIKGSSGGVTGGLVGSVTGNKSKLNYCAAAVYVESNAGTGTAPVLGGMVGSAAATEITACYSGGHTDNALYRSGSDSEKIGRINVKGLGNSVAGGLVGELTSNSLVKDSYSTCSVQGGIPSGLIGSAQDSTVNHCYATGRVEASVENGSTQAFVGKAVNTEFKGNSYYLTDVSPSDNSAKINNVTGVSAQDSGASDFILSEAARQSAIAYDPTLRTNYKGNYYFSNLNQWTGTEYKEGVIASALASHHYGDWQIPDLKPLNFEILNRDKLILQLKNGEDDDTPDLLTLAVKGRKSGVTEVYVFQRDGDKFVIDSHYQISGNTKSDLGTAEYDFQITESGSDTYFVLDDITTPHSHFHELFAGLTPGENIDVYITGGTAPTWQDILNKMGNSANVKKTNSLFDVDNKGEIGNANIFNIRHLQNLEPTVSGVSSEVTEAKLCADLNWKKDSTGLGWLNWSLENTKIYNNNSSCNIADSFVGIYNNNLVSFDALYNDGTTNQYNTIGNFVVYGYNSEMGSAEGTGNAGLFRLVRNGLKVTNLHMDETEVSAAAFAGTIAAQVTGSGMEIRNSLVTGTVTILANSTAGGLVGSFAPDSNGTLTVLNSAASVMVKSDNGNAGGILGSHTGGNVSIGDSYVGGHTLGGKYDITAAGKYNIVAIGSGYYAGGLVGLSQEGSLTITNTSSAASVAVTENDGSSFAGGIIGGVSGSAAMASVYTAAPVYGADENKTYAGAFIGKVAAGTSLSKVVKENAGVNCFLMDSYSNHGDRYYDEIEVKAIGSGEGDIASGAYYFSSSEDSGNNNPISAIYNKTRIQRLTYPYDNTLSGSEYPFYIWTSLYDYENDRGQNLYYYGDWEPCQVKERQTSYSAAFSCKLPDGEVISVAGDLGNQPIITAKNNRLQLPSTLEVPGYTIENWIIPAKGEDGADIILEAEDGWITIPARYCSDNVNIVAVYEKIPEVHLISFLYDNPLEEGTVWKDMVKPYTVSDNTTFKQITPPSKIISGHVFKGWYSTPDYKDGSEIDFSSDNAIDGDLTAYAKYLSVEYYNITVDFYYQIELGEVVPLSGKDARAVVKYVKGEYFDGNISIPSEPENTEQIIPTKYDDGGKIITNPGELEDITLNENKKSVHITTDDTKTTRFALIFRVAPDKTYKYRVRYHMHDTLQDKSQSPIGQLVLKYNEGTTYTFFPSDYAISNHAAGYRPDVEEISDAREGWSRSSTVNVVEAEGDSSCDYYLDVDYDREEYTLSYDTRGGSYISTVVLKYGQPLVKPANNPTRKGYDFDTWVIHSRNAVEDPEYVFKLDGVMETYDWSSAMPAYDMIASAKWKLGEADYYIIYWKQNVNDDRDLNKNKLHDQKTYDFYAMETYSGNTGGSVTLPSGYNNMVSDNPDDFYGFEYLRNDAAGKTIAGDGSTVVNVYYDRKTLTMEFYTDKYMNNLYNAATYSYNKGTGDDAVYGLIDGKYVELTKGTDNKWYYQETYEETEEYTVSHPEETGTYTGTVYYNDPATVSGTYTVWNKDAGSMEQQNLYYIDGKFYNSVPEQHEYSGMVYHLADSTAAGEYYLEAENGVPQSEKTTLYRDKGKWYKTKSNPHEAFEYTGVVDAYRFENDKNTYADGKQVSSWVVNEENGYTLNDSLWFYHNEFYKTRTGSEGLSKQDSTNGNIEENNDGYYHYSNTYYDRGWHTDDYKLTVVPSGTLGSDGNYYYYTDDDGNKTYLYKDASSLTRTNTSVSVTTSEGKYYYQGYLLTSVGDNGYKYNDGKAEKYLVKGTNYSSDGTLDYDATSKANITESSNGYYSGNNKLTNETGNYYYYTSGTVYKTYHYYYRSDETEIVSELDSYGIDTDVTKGVTKKGSSYSYVGKTLSEKEDIKVDGTNYTLYSYDDNGVTKYLARSGSKPSNYKWYIATPKYKDVEKHIWYDASKVRWYKANPTWYNARLTSIYTYSDKVDAYQPQFIDPEASMDNTEVWVKDGNSYIKQTVYYNPDTKKLYKNKTPVTAYDYSDEYTGNVYEGKSHTSYNSSDIKSGTSYIGIIDGKVVTLTPHVSGGSVYFTYDVSNNEEYTGGRYKEVSENESGSAPYYGIKNSQLVNVTADTQSTAVYTYSDRVYDVNYSFTGGYYYKGNNRNKNILTKIDNTGKYSYGSGSSTKYLYLNSSTGRWYESRTEKQEVLTTYTYTIPAYDSIETRVVTKSRNVEYTGDRYKYEASGEETGIFWGLYGQPLSKYGYAWPSAKGWSYNYNKSTSGTGMSYLGQFVFPNGTTNTTMYLFTSDTVNKATEYFYLQNIDGVTYSAVPDATGTTSSGSAGFSFTDKYDGFNVSQYVKDKTLAQIASGSGVTWSSIPSGGSAGSFNSNLHIRFARKSHTLIFYNVTEAKEVSVNDKVYYETPLNSLERPTLPTLKSNPNADMVWDGKYYADMACSREFDFRSLMPNTNLMIFMKTEAPQFTVEFYEDEPGNGTDIDPTLSLVRTKYQTLYDGEGDQSINDVNGDIRPQLNPEREGFIFDGWYYRNAGGDEHSFFFANSITRNLKVYAKWIDASVPTWETADITVRYLRADDHTVKVAEDKVMPQQAVGDSVSVVAAAVDGYSADKVLQFHTVAHRPQVGDDPNVVEFYYSPVEPWRYNLEYYIMFNNIEDIEDVLDEADSSALGEGISYSKDGAVYLLDKRENIECTNQYETVSFNMPRSIVGCEFDHYAYEDVNNGTGSFVTIHPDENGRAVVKYYLVPDDDSFMLDAGTYQYDGEAKSTGAVKGETITFGPDKETKVSAVPYGIYKYFDAEGKTPVAPEKVKDVGTYSLHGYLVYEVTGTKVGDSSPSTAYYLVYKDNDGSLKLYITQRHLKISSKSAAGEYNGENPLICHEYEITPEGAFPEGEGVKVLFSDDAFRLEPGTTVNKFNYEAEGDTNLDNYFITTQFGTLTVYGGNN